MSITKSVASQNSIGGLSLHRTVVQRSHLEQHPVSCFPINKPTVTRLWATPLVKWNRPMIACATNETAGTSPSAPPSGGSWKNWAIGFLMTFIVSFVTTKGGPIKALFQRVDQVMETAEHIADVVEAVADKVDKVVEEIEAEVPEGSQLRKTLDFIESVAERVEKDANTVDEFIDKVQEMEDKIEEAMAPVLEEAKTINREKKEKKKSKKL